MTGVIPSTGVISGRADLLLSTSAYAGFTNLTGAPVSYTWVFANVPGHTDATAATVATTIRQHFPLLSVTTVPQAQQQVQGEIDGIRTFLRIVGLLALLIGGVGISNTMQVLLRHRFMEIAMLKTQGYRQRDLLRLFGLEAVLLGTLGGAVGALVGIGVSFGVQALVERAFGLTLPTIIDPGIVLSGLLIGMGTTVIFGILPIVRSSAVRPLAILRETSPQRGTISGVQGFGLVLLVGTLFFALALSILGNVGTTLAVVFVASAFLGVLTIVFAGVASLISHWPVPNRRRWWSYLAPVPFLVVGLLVWRPAPGFGALLLAVGAVSLGAGLLPTTARAEAQLALRNIGRARARSATTLVALFIGVFAVGLGLVLGQNLKEFVAARNATVNQANTYILATSQQAPQVAAQIAHLSGVTHEQTSLAVPDQITMVNGQPVASAAGDTPSLSGINGFNLSANSVPPAILEQGTQDLHPGRLLTAADAGTTNAVFPLTTSQAPLNLMLGDAVQVTNLDGMRRQTLQVIGFYSGSGTFGNLAAVLADQGVVTTLSAGQPYTIFALALPQATQAQQMQQLKVAVPGIITVGDVAALNQIDTILDNITQVVEAVAALAMLAGLILIANTVALAMLERRRELGLLKAIGHSSRGVFGMVLVENGVVGLVGAVVALVLVSLASVLLSQLAFGATTGGASAGVIIAVAAATVLVCLLVAGSVAWRPAQLRPIEVLRYE